MFDTFDLQDHKDPSSRAELESADAAELSAGLFSQEAFLACKSEMSSHNKNKCPAKEIDMDSAEPAQIVQAADRIAEALNLGRADKAMALLSEKQKQFSSVDFNKLLLSVQNNELPEEYGDDRGHLLLSDWNEKTATWDQVYVEESSQLFRLVQPGNTLRSFAVDRLGAALSEEAIKRYMENILETNSISNEEFLTGTFLRLPYPY